MAKTPKDFNDYAARFPNDTQSLLRKMRQIIRKAAPGATETISYGIPAFRTDRTIVWFSAFEHHIGFYPGASGIKKFKKELAGYKYAKGSVRFPLDEPLPVGLITRMVKFRVNEQRAKTKTT